MAFPVLGQPHPTYTDPNGDPYSSGTLTFTEPSDGSPKYTYDTAAGADAATLGLRNPSIVTLNQRGSTTTGIWGIDGEKYDVTLKDVDGNTIWTAEDVAWDATVTGSTLVHIARTAAEQTAGIPEYIAGVTTQGTIVQPWLEPGNVERYGIHTTPGTTEMTVAIQAALDSNGYVWLQPNLTYIVDSLHMKNDDIIFDLNTATLKLLDNVPIAYSPVIYISPLEKDGTEWDSGIRLRSNIVVRNGIIDGNQANNLAPDTSSPYDGSDGGMHCVWIANSCKNIKLENLKLTNAATDGLEIAVDDGINTSHATDAVTTEVYVTDVDMDANYRQGCSIIKADTVHFTRCLFRNTSGAAPEAGLDMETNLATEDITNIKCTDCSFTGNAGRGVQGQITGGEGKYWKFSNCYIAGNVTGGDPYSVAITGSTGSVYTDIQFSNCTIVGSVSCGAVAANTIKHDIKFADCRIGIATANAAALVSRDLVAGSTIRLINCVLEGAPTSTSTGVIDIGNFATSDLIITGGEIYGGNANSIGIYVLTADGSTMTVTGTLIDSLRTGIQVAGTTIVAYIGGGAIIRNCATLGLLSYNDTVGKDPTIVIADATVKDCGTGAQAAGSQAPQLQVLGTNFQDCTTNTIGITLQSELRGTGVPTMNAGLGSTYIRDDAGNANQVLYVCYPANTWVPNVVT